MIEASRACDMEQAHYRTPGFIPDLGSGTIEKDMVVCEDKEK
jgi:hypothetical protein